MRKMDSKQKSLNRKKHNSMDNVTSLLKDYQIKDSKTKLYGNWIKNGESCKQAKGERIKLRDRFSP
jgi:hypothetical protein